MELKSLSYDPQYTNAGLEDAYHIVYYIPKNQDLTDWSEKVSACKRKVGQDIINECVNALNIEGLYFDYVIRMMGHKETIPLKNAPIRSLAVAIADATGAKYLPQLLHKKKETTPMHFLSLAERQVEINDVFQVNDRTYNLNEKKILIVDDITTTCTTVAEMIKTLKKVWPKAIFYLFCIARTSHDEHANENL